MSKTATLNINRKRLILTFFTAALIAVFLLISVPAHAAASANVKAEPSAASVKTGDSFDILVQISEPAAYTYEIKGTYGAQAELTGVELPATADEINKGITKTGSGAFTLMNTIDAPQGDGTVAKLKFRALSSGTFQVRISGARVFAEVTGPSDLNEAEMTVTTDNCSVTITGNTVEPSVTASPAPAPTKTPSSTGTGGGGGGGGGGGFSSTPMTGGTAETPTAAPGTPGTSEPGATSAPYVDPAEKFNDLTGYDWAKDAIYELSDMGIIKGTSDATFDPGANIIRGDFILILSRMFELNDEFSENFADVPEGSYYYDAIGSARAAGVAQGDGDYFRPNDNISRQDLITLTYRVLLGYGYISEAADASSLDAFTDKSMISDYAVLPLASMVDKGIIQGNDGQVNPLGNATRAEAAVMCSRIVKLIPAE